MAKRLFWLGCCIKGDHLCKTSNGVLSHGRTDW
jgi:hypothetical protein